MSETATISRENDDRITIKRETALAESISMIKQMAAAVNMTEAEICLFYNGIIVAANKPVWFHRITSNPAEARKNLGEVMELLLSVGLSASIGPAGFPIIRVLPA